MSNQGIAFTTFTAPRDPGTGSSKDEFTSILQRFIRANGVLDEPDHFTAQQNTIPGLIFDPPTYLYYEVADSRYSKVSVNELFTASDNQIDDAVGSLMIAAGIVPDVQVPSRPASRLKVSWRRFVSPVMVAAVADADVADEANIAAMRDNWPDVEISDGVYFIWRPSSQIRQAGTRVQRPVSSLHFAFASDRESAQALGGNLILTLIQNPFKPPRNPFTPPSSSAYLWKLTGATQ